MLVSIFLTSEMTSLTLGSGSSISRMVGSSFLTSSSSFSEIQQAPWACFYHFAPPDNVFANLIAFFVHFLSFVRFVWLH
jgi:hypothetical protein